MDKEPQLYFISWDHFCDPKLVRHTMLANHGSQLGVDLCSEDLIELLSIAWHAHPRVYRALDPARKLATSLVTHETVVYR